MRRLRLATSVAGLGLALLAAAANAQGPGGIAQDNTAFDQQFWGRLQQLQRQNATAQQQLFQTYLQQNGPWLRRAYEDYVAATGMAVTFEQFAYYMLITANGTNAGAALDMQRRQFQSWQDSNRTVQDGNRAYNDAWQRNGEATDRAVGGWTEGAIRGNAPYTDPRTGATLLLPYGAQPGQVINQGGSFYLQDQQGTYYQYQGKGYWARMGSAR